jgi:hypothetical protein
LIDFAELERILLGAGHNRGIKQSASPVGSPESMFGAVCTGKVRHERPHSEEVGKLTSFNALMINSFQIVKRRRTRREGQHKAGDDFRANFFFPEILNFTALFQMH